MPESQRDQKQLREKFRKVEVYIATNVVQYWRATVGLEQIQSTLADGAAFLESDYAGDLRIYMRKGYESEQHPVELAAQLLQFFSIPPEHSDLVSIALTATVARLTEIFELRGIPPLVDDTLPPPRVMEDESHRNAQLPDYKPDEDVPLPKEPRASRILRRAKFAPELFNNGTDTSTPTPLQTLGPAVARSTLGVDNLTGNVVRTAPSPFTVKSLKGIMKDLEVAEKDGGLVGTPSQKPTLLDRLVSLRQTNAEIGQMIVSLSLNSTCRLLWRC